MNVSTGGPHILFFERDSQLTTLLTSQFQLAGYECHAARTAVEVFDTIARFPVRILLVNLAQAAAGRREFWVALDTQRRGRGVQVLTYLCSNLAGYGPRDTDDRPQGQLPDIEIDGMLGLMSLVDVVRQRVPGMASANSQSTQVRLPRTAPPSTPTPSGTSSPTSTSGTAYRASSVPETPRAATITTSVVTQTLPAQQSYSEKIRAVLYPTQRPANVPAQTNTLQSSQEIDRPAAYGYDRRQNVSQVEQATQRSQNTQAYDANETTLHRLAYGQPVGEQESGLDQLSRMLQERGTYIQDESTSRVANEGNRYAPASSTIEAPQQSGTNYAPTTQVAQSTGTIGTQPLRASPIEDLPLERVTNGTSMNGRRVDGRTNYGQYSGNTQTAPTNQTTPLASISTVRTTIAPDAAPAVTKATMPIAAVTVPQPVEKSATQEQQSIQGVQQREQYSEQQSVHEMPIASVEQTNVEPRIDNARAAEQQNVSEGEEWNGVTPATTVREQQEQILEEEQQGLFTNGMTPNNAMLLDIVQSLPLMPSPPPQPALQAVSGRTMRTLGSVLLEGHLVPQSRLEVAQNIQRMLSGVDLSYQLGEILLMFKLLTPDQLLAASLVSHGMISAQQITALGRIRQELHSVGLEYDLESLLILFRMITPEQLREVRTSWQG